jgi:PAS domain S-box-containing protein
MKTNVFDRIVSIPQTFLGNGIRAHTPRELQKKMLRINLFLVFALVVAFISLVFSYMNQLFVSAMVHLGAVFLITVGFFLNKDGKVQASKFLGILTINVHLFTISHLEGLRSGTYLLVFPLLFTLVFVIDIRKTHREVILTSLVTLLTTVLIFILSPYQNLLQKIPQELYSSLYGTNLAISLTLTAIFAFIILKTLENHEAKIIEEKNLSETIYDTSLDAVFIVNAYDGLITGCNLRALEVFGLGGKERVRHRPTGELLGSEVETHIAHFNRNRNETLVPWYGNMELYRQEGTPFHAYVNIVPFRHDHQLYCKISILDITDIKVAEFETIRAKEKAERATLVKSRFLSMMSHELRTPLNGIIGTTNLLLQDECLEAQRPYMDVLKHSSEHMLHLVNDILDFSKLEAGKMLLDSKPFNLREFLQKAVRPFTTGSPDAGVKFELDIDDALDTEIVSDELRLNQIMNNLLSNARKFTSSGHIRVKARQESSDGQNIQVLFSVSDTGIGIHPHKIRQIFESFTQADAETTRRFGGTGLGLAISRHIVEQMGGKLEVRSIPDQGSEFYFTIRLRISRIVRSIIQEGKDGELASLNGLRILIAEDNPVNMIVAKRFLHKWDVVVDEAVNGLQLLDCFSRNDYDLLLVDLEMPEMDGAQAVSKIRVTSPDIPIIAFTAAVYENIQTDLLQKGFNDFIPKPFKPAVLHRKIRQLAAYRGLSKVKYG